MTWEFSSLFQYGLIKDEKCSYKAFGNTHILKSLFVSFYNFQKFFTSFTSCRYRHINKSENTSHPRIYKVLPLVLKISLLPHIKLRTSALFSKKNETLQNLGIWFGKYLFRKIRRKTPVPESLFLIKLQAEARNFIKKDTLTHVFSSDFCKILKKPFYRTPQDDCFWFLWTSIPCSTTLTFPYYSCFTASNIL